MHLPGMNFAGPGTKLNERLTSTDAYKEWSKPIDRVDNAAYHHDLAYQHFTDTANRNLADRMMIKEMVAIKNPTTCEKIERERKCRKLWVDKGREFFNKHVKALGVELYSTENEEKICVVERWNRTMKEKMFKYFSANSTRKYVDVLDEMVNKYNNTRHSSIKMTPVKASDEKNKNIVWLNLNGNARSESVRPKFSINDRVRITKKKTTFEKGYTLRWTEEVFTISQIQYTDPLTYKITDNNGEEIQGTFYEQKLIKTNQEIFRIEKVICKLKNKLLVKWYGYPELFNSWVDNKELIDLSDP
ncbi:uncharacterized protein LOC136087870 [Hydra vulgaris]|uniref:Uncharacterized protein LOC136087870 n=1 Tax=Hydra vulgaris TaxID=6087 RepID=A0ABM4D001_HYDVU